MSATIQTSEGAQSMNMVIHIPDVAERDIDLLLLEEIAASADFGTWFLAQIGVEQVICISMASRSVKTESGESDLELVCTSSEGEIMVLVENKVDAAFQPNQSQRYLLRARGHGEGGRYKRVVTAIVAPESYFGVETENFGFDAKITYESILGWFLETNYEDPRRAYKTALLRVAIDRGRTGWQLVPHLQVSQFWEMYWKLSDEIAPQLAMPIPRKEIPAGSHFIVFQPSALPSNIKLKHKVAYGNVDLEFREMGGRMAEMERMYRELLPPSTKIERAGKSAVIRARVEPVDMINDDFASNELKISNGIEAAVRLLDWYNKAHQSSIS